jgi:hypothetical protein
VLDWILFEASTRFNDLIYFFEHAVIGVAEIVHLDVVAFVAITLQNALSELRFEVEGTHSINDLIMMAVVDLHNYLLVDQYVYYEVLYLIKYNLLGI